MLAIFLIVVGFIFGRLWFGVIVLPLLYGLPRTACHILHRNLQFKAIIVYIVPIVLWSILFVVVGFIVALAGLRDLLYSSRDFFIGQWVGAAAGVLQALGKRGRQDLTLDFWEAVGRYRSSSSPTPR